MVIIEIIKTTIAIIIINIVIIIASNSNGINNKTKKMETTDYMNNTKTKTKIIRAAIPIHSPAALCNDL